MQKYYRDEPSNNTKDCTSFKFKSGLIDKTDKMGTVNTKIVVPVKYWRLK